MEKSNTYTLVQGVPDGIRKRIKGHFKDKGRGKDCGREAGALADKDFSVGI
jgi:hypothetical protein